MYFNVRDPNFNKTNVPIRKESSNHYAVMITNIIFWGGLIGGILLASI